MTSRTPAPSRSPLRSDPDFTWRRDLRGRESYVAGASASPTAVK
jgi:hypothetical protein